MPVETSNAEPRETELKLLIRRQDRPALERHPLLQASGAPEERDEVTTYFDTGRLALAKQGFSLRIRRSGDKRIQTLKSAAIGHTVAKSRGEWEWSLDADAPDLARIAEASVGADVLAEAAAGLEPVFQTEIRRTVRHLDLPSGALVEAAFDEGQVSSGAARQDVTELELELKRGSPGSLYRLALELHGLAPFTIGTESKAERGRRLRTGEAPPAVVGDPPRLNADEPTGAAVRRIIATELAHLLANQAPAAAGAVEGVHQMRVGIRRLRTVLVVFGKWLDREMTDGWEAELKRLGQVFGAARDWDVFAIETLAAAEGDDSTREWAAALRDPADDERRLAHAAVRQELGHPALTGLILAMAAWAEPDNDSPSDHRRLQRRVGRVVPGMLDDLASRVEKRGSRCKHRSPEELHDLRKALKKLRYSVDYVSGFFPSKGAQPYRRAAKRLLNLLGTVNDAQVASSLAERLGTTDPVLLGPATLGLRDWTEHRAAQARRKLPKAWAAFTKETPLWH